MRSLGIVISLLTAIVLISTGAQAHAALDRASPAVGSTVPAAPQEVTLTFTHNLEAAFSSIEVTDTSGGRVDDGKPQVSGNTMHVGLKSLQPGAYQVHWHVLATDTHKTQGSFTFRVGSH